MAADVVASNVRLDAAGRIAQDVPCIHCGYNLRSLLPEQACPECNQLVGQSLRGDQLRYSDPRWLRRLCHGMTWVLAGCIAWLAVRWVGLQYLASVVYLPGVPPTAREAVWWSLMFGMPVIGVWLVTWPEPGLAGTYRDSTVRKAARVLAAGYLLLTFTSSLYLPAGTAAKPLTSATFRWKHLDDALLFLLGAAGWVAFCISIRPLARRAGAVRLARWTWWAAVVLGSRGLLLAGMLAWLSAHVPQLIAGSPGKAIGALMTIGWIVFPLEPLAILLIAILYGRVFRREARLGGR